MVSQEEKWRQEDSEKDDKFFGKIDRLTDALEGIAAAGASGGSQQHDFKQGQGSAVTVQAYFDENGAMHILQ